MRFLKLLKQCLKFLVHVLKTIAEGILYLIALISMIAAIVGVYNLDLLGRKPFRFEKFKSKEEAQEFFAEKFPKGSDALEMMAFLEAGGAGCRKEKSYRPKQDFHYDKLYICSYQTNLISRDPVTEYLIYIYTDFNNQVIALDLTKYCGALLCIFNFNRE